MGPARSIPDYLRRPFGCYYLGSAFLHFFVDETLCGTLFFGRPEASDIVELTHVLAVELSERSPPHQVYVDTRRLTGASATAFQTLADYIGLRVRDLGRNVSRQALVRPKGVLGAMVAGFHDATSEAYRQRTRLFDDARTALAWLGRSDAKPLLIELDEIAAAATRESPLLCALHTHVLANPRRATLAVAAQALGLSARALQRQLQRAGTTFQREVKAARVAAAKTMLAEGDTRLSAIALAVGCLSLPHFSRLFSDVTGSSPSQWRALHRL